MARSDGDGGCDATVFSVNNEDCRLISCGGQAKKGAEMRERKDATKRRPRAAAEREGGRQQAAMTRSILAFARDH